jgi:serine/threonine protein kinase/tetratricopeptide (TPR) repeat protein
MMSRTISHYEILEKLGEGGMGVVYKAQDIQLQRLVALKFLPPHVADNSDEKARFIHEAQSASALNHPNVTTVYGIEESPEGMFIAMEYVDGRTLKQIIEEETLSIKKVLDIGIQMCEGIAMAHEKGVVHRDIKSDNIKVTSRGQVKIMDFGLAKLKGATKITQTGSTLGTASYMSPEQASGEEIDHRSDIFSFGVVLYELITGHLPFKGEHQAAIIYSVINETPEPLGRYKVNVPESLQRIIDKTLEKNRTTRYQHADDLRADLMKLSRELESGLTITMIPGEKPLPSVAVLPFVNLSGDPEQEYFCDGMTEEIINALSQIEDLRVVARTSAFVFKDKREDIREIGRKLNVETLLEGSVRKSGERLRITAQLVKVSDGYHLWSERFDRDLADVFTIQDEISLAIVDKLKVKLLGDEREKLLKRYTQNLEAYELYLKGRYHWNRRMPAALKKAMGHFEQVIQKDPNYALAYAGLADCYSMLVQVYVLPPKEAFPRAKALASKALEIDETLAEAHTSLAFALSSFYWDWAGAEREFKRAIELNSNYATAHQWFAMGLLLKLGRTSQAFEEINKALELDPLSLIINIGVSYLYLAIGRLEKAMEQAEKVLDIDPTFGVANLILAEVNERKGKYDEAVEEFFKSVSFIGFLSQQEEAALQEASVSFGRTGYLRRWLEILQSKVEKGQVLYYEIASLHARLDETEKAIEYLEKAYEEHDFYITDVLMDNNFAKLRSNPRFVQLIKKMGFPE